MKYTYWSILAVILVVSGLLWYYSYSYEVTTWDREMLERIDLNLKERVAKSTQTVPLMIRAQKAIRRVIEKVELEARISYLLNAIDGLLTTNIEESEIGQPAGSIDRWTWGTHLFQYLWFGWVEFNNYVTNRWPVGWEYPDISISLSNSSSGSVLGEVLLICGAPWFIQYEYPKGTKLSIDPWSSWVFGPTYIRSELNSMMNATGSVSMECRVYDNLYTKDFYATSVSFEVVEPETEYPEIVFEWIAQDTSYRTLDDSSKNSINLSLFFRNQWTLWYSWSVQAACDTPAWWREYEESLRWWYIPILSWSGELEEIEPLEISYTSFAWDIKPWAVVGRELVLDYGTYAKWDVIECRLNKDMYRHIYLKKDLPVFIQKHRVK